MESIWRLDFNKIIKFWNKFIFIHINFKAEIILPCSAVRSWSDFRCHNSTSSFQVNIELLKEKSCRKYLLIVMTNLCTQAGAFILLLQIFGILTSWVRTVKALLVTSFVCFSLLNSKALQRHLRTSLIFLKFTNKYANSAYPDQTAPWSGSAPFGQTCLFKIVLFFSGRPTCTCHRLIRITQRYVIKISLFSDLCYLVGEIPQIIC